MADTGFQPLTGGKRWMGRQMRKGVRGVLIKRLAELINAGVKPAGLAARDILRMEMKYWLYGNDIDNTTNPIEAGLNIISPDVCLNRFSRNTEIHFNKISYFTSCSLVYP